MSQNWFDWFLKGEFASRRLWEKKRLKSCIKNTHDRSKLRALFRNTCLVLSIQKWELETVSKILVGVYWSEFKRLSWSVRGISCFEVLKKLRHYFAISRWLMINCYIAMETYVPCRITSHPPLVNHRACDSFTQLFSSKVLCTRCVSRVLSRPNLIVYWMIYLWVINNGNMWR